MTLDFSAFLTELESHPSRSSCENLVVAPRVRSTNRIGVRIARECLGEQMRIPPCFLVAFEQSAGRGRQGRGWVSPPGRGIYATWIEPLSGEAREALATLPLLVGVGLARGVNRLLGAAPDDGPCRLKWPNDLVVEGRKLGGILIEVPRGAGPRPENGEEENESQVAEEEGVEEVGGTSSGATSSGTTGCAAVIGFGINHAVWAEGTSEVGEGLPPTSIRGESSDAPGIAQSVWTLFDSLRAELEHAGDAPYALSAYRTLSAHRPGDTLRCRLPEATLEGVFRGFDERGFLRLVLPAGEERLLAAGEIVEP